MPERKRPIAEIVILTILAVVTAAMLWWTRPKASISRRSTGPTPSTVLASPFGAKAFYELLGRMGFNAVRSTRPLLPDAFIDFDVLVILGVADRHRASEMEALRDWIRNGGVLVCTAAFAEGLEADGTADTVGLTTDEPVWIVTDEPLPERRVPTEVADPSLPLAANVQRLALDDEPEEAVLDRSQDDETDLQPLLRTEAGPLIARRDVGEGMMIVLASRSFLQNDWIGEADNAVLATNLAAYARAQARGPRLAFEEYHLGVVGEGGTLLVGVLLATAPGWAVCALTLAGILLLWRHGVKFGRRLGAEPPRRRDRMESIRALAGTYRKAEAYSTVARLLRGWMRRRCARRAGLAASASDAEIAAGLHRVAGVDRNEVLRAFATSQVNSGRDLDAFTRRLTELERKLEDGRTIRS